MAIISVFRVENKFGQGMYRCKGPRISSANSYKESEQCHPYASKEILDFLEACSEPKNYLFGFPSVELMRKWIQKRSVAEHLDKSGFTFCEFRIDEQYVIADEAQLIFNKEHAKIISSIFVADAWDDYKAKITPDFNVDKETLVWPTSFFFDSFQQIITPKFEEDYSFSWKITSNEMFIEPKVVSTTKKPKPYFRVKERY